MRIGRLTDKLIELEELLLELEEEESSAEGSKGVDLEVISITNVSAAPSVTPVESLIDSYLECEDSVREHIELLVNYVKELEYRAEERNVESRRIKELSNKCKARAEVIRESLVNALLKTNRSKVSTLSYELSVRAKGSNSKTVELLAAVEDLPIEYQRIKIEPAVNKIKSALLKHEDPALEKLATLNNPTTSHSLIIK